METILVDIPLLLIRNDELGFACRYFPYVVLVLNNLIVM